MKQIKFTAFLLLASFLSACSQQKPDEGKVSFGIYDVAGKSAETSAEKISSNDEQSITPVTQASLLNQAEQTQTAPIVIERQR